MKLIKAKIKGFTLVELLIYTSVFVIAAGLLTTILVTTTRVENTEIVNTQVGQELNLILTTVQRLVRDSSLIECVGDATNITDQANCATSTTPGSFLRLRLEDQTKDPTCVYLDNGIAKLAQGPDPANKQFCNLAAATNLTTTQVTANSLTFTKFDIPGGHATVQIDAQLTFNSSNPELQITKTLRSAVGRVSAATFDSDLLPDSTAANRNIGDTTKSWRNFFLTGLLKLGTFADPDPTNIGVGSIYYNTTSNSLKAYDGTDWKTVSQTPWSQNVNAAGFTLFGNSTPSGILTLDSTSDATKGNIILNPTGGYVGINTITPGANLDIKDTLRLSGATSGYVGIKAPAAAGSITYTLPSADGSSGQFLSTNGVGVLNWASAAAGSSSIVFSNGLDGDVIISANTTLTRDWHYNNLTVNSGITLNTAGYRVLVKGILTNNGVIANNGGAGGSLAAGGAGGGGGGYACGVGGVGVSKNPSMGSAGGRGGDGSGCTGNGGAGGTVTNEQVLVIKQNIPVTNGLTEGVETNISNLVDLSYLLLSGVTSGITGSASAGGGGGGGGVSNPDGGSGGSGGAGGGIVFISARTLANNGTIQARGGNGGGGSCGYVGVFPGGGGGGGGGGGAIVLFYETLSNLGALDVAGGAGGPSAPSSCGGSPVGTAGTVGKIYRAKITF